MTDARGRFIVFEGLDGAGTSTQLARLQQWLLSRGYPAEGTHEPSSGPVGAAIRQALEGRLSLDPVALALAFAADRVDHVSNPVQGITAKLDAGWWVLCDRYLASTLAYQSSPSMSVDWLLSINRFAPAPDLTIYVDTDAELCMERIRTRGSGPELFHRLEEMRRVAGSYPRALERPEVTGKLVVVDGSQPVDDLFADVLRHVTGWLDVTGGRRPL